MAHGMIGIVDGGVVLHPPQAGGEVPTVAPGPNITVIVNGVEIASPVPVGPQDKIEILPATNEGGIDYSVEVSPDGLEAYLYFQKIPGVTVELVDAPPQRQLQPQGVVRNRPIPDNPSPAEIVAALEQSDVRYGLDMDVIQAVSRGELKGRQRIARGTPPIPGQDAWIELCFEQDESSFHESEAGRVDYFERAEVVRVEAGDTLAILHPATEGQEGRTVTGEIIQPSPPQELNIRVRDGAELSPDKTKVVATRDGRPLFLDNEFSVSEVLEINGNVDIKSGNVRYKGDVIVRGDIEENLLVEASGAVEIRGNVVQARIDSQTNIRVVGQVVGSELTVGAMNESIVQLEEFIQGVVKELTTVSHVGNQLTERLPGRGDTKPPAGPVFLLLLEKRFSKLLPRIEKLRQLVLHESFSLVVDQDEATKRVDAFSKSSIARLRTSAEFATAIDGLLDLAASLNALRAANGHFVGGYAQRSQIRVSGCAFFQGHGAYQTDVQAGEFVVVQGVFRGGVAKAGKGAFIREAGSPGEVETSINLQEGAFFRASIVHPGVQVQIGTRTWKASRPRQNVEVRLSKNGSIETTSFASWNPPAPSIPSTRGRS